MTWPLLQLTSAPSMTADVLYDFNVDPDQFVSGNDPVDFGVPEWSGAPDVVGGLYDFRTVTFTHLVEGSSPTAWAELATLSRLLLASESWLLVQMSRTSEPRWFHVWRSTPASLDPSNALLHNDNLQGLWGIAVSLRADPWLYGARVTQPTVTVANDPSAAANPVGFTLPDVAGDASVPLQIAAVPSGVSTPPMLMSMNSGPVSRVPILLNIGVGDAWLPSGDACPTATAPNTVGGSYRAIPFTTTPTALVSRLNASSLPTIPIGVYKVLIRTINTGGYSTVAIQVSSGIGAPSKDDVATPVTTVRIWGAGWIDVGEIALPHGVAPDGMASPTPSAATLKINAALVAGVAPLNLDALLLVPVDVFDTVAGSTIETIAASSTGSTGAVYVWNGDTEEFWVTGSTGNVFGGSGVTMSGVFLNAIPGMSNRVTVLQRTVVGSAAADDQIVATTDVTVSYLPRWLWPAS